MNKRLRYAVVLFVLAVLAGCPDSPNSNPNGTNSLTLHNNYDHDIYSLSVTRIGPVDPVPTKGMNILPEPLQPGETFCVENLVDGKYELAIGYYYHYFGEELLRHGGYGMVIQSLEGGLNYDWYFDDKKAASDECLESNGPTMKAILNGLLGL